jgi:hypothetical protein
LTKAEAFGISDPALLSIVAKEGAKFDAAATAEWVGNQDAALITELGAVVATFWAENDPAAAFGWAEEHGVSLTDNISENARKTPENARKTPDDMGALHAAEMSRRSPFSAAFGSETG